MRPGVGGLSKEVVQALFNKYDSGERRDDRSNASRLDEVGAS